MLEKIFLYHYYEAAHGPFQSLSALDHEAAEAVLQKLREEGKTFASQRKANYLLIRRQLEEQIRQLFIQKKGEPQRRYPHYMLLEPCTWLKEWYHEGHEVKIPLKLFSARTISFTYGDSFPAMRYQDGKPYRGQVYTLHELPELLAHFGLPQQWNPHGEAGPERYIEAQIWDDLPTYDE